MQTLAERIENKGKRNPEAKAIPFFRPFLTGKELEYISGALQSGKLEGDGEFSKKCQEFLKNRFKTREVYLTPSGTAALEMAAILLDLQPGDEIIMPSFTFPSTANAFVLRGARPCFVDIRPDTLNIDENQIESVIRSKTRAIMPVHYAGVSAEMDRIGQVARKYGLKVIEDAAQGINAQYKGRFLGTLGDMAAYSFHATKHVICGEGGAILLNTPEYIERAEIVREKGTNRKKFLRGEIDKYTWVDVGSSFLLGDVLAAFLWAQFEEMDAIQSRRKTLYEFYGHLLKPLEKKGVFTVPVIPRECATNYHLFYFLLESERQRNALLKHLKGKNIGATFHFIPLHESAFGRKFNYREGDFPVSESVSRRLLRLPFYVELTFQDQERIVNEIIRYLG